MRWLGVTDYGGNLARTLAVGLSADDLTARRGFIGGSDANLIARGELAPLQRLWREKTGRSRPPDLSHRLPVMMGSWTEELNRHWFERQTGLEVTCEGKRLIHADYPYLAVTLDGLTSTPDGDQAVFEAKHVNERTYNPDIVLGRYMPQLTHAMYVVGCRHAVLSVLIGTEHWQPLWVEYDPLYAAELLAAERAFWRHVTEDQPFG
jgi:predicted phage-related endonuclease